MKLHFDADACLLDCLSLLVKDFPLDPLLKSSKEGRRREDKEAAALAGKLLDHTQETVSPAPPPFPLTNPSGSSPAATSFPPSYHANLAAGGVPGTGVQGSASVYVSLLGACAADIEDHLARFLPGSRKWIFEE